MAKAVRFRDKWRSRWTDEHGRRRSAFFEKHSDAAVFLREREVEVAQIKRGVRPPNPGDRTFNELCDLWIANRASQKRSGKDDESIIRCHLRPEFGSMIARCIGVADSDRFVLARKHALVRARDPSDELDDDEATAQLSLELG